MSNTDLVLKMYDYFGKGDMDAIRAEVFHPEITWAMPGHHPLSGLMKGADEVIAFFADLFKAGIQVDNVHFGELDDGTVVEKHTGHGTSEGVDYIFPTCTSYGIEDGKIRAVQVHTADQHGVDRYMWSRFELKGVGERLAA
ncbi:nuclear transport factor 2 family protein [Actinoplanes sp. RD1]|uniref:nuclear transport factor 2 family protein n=1 Tax=Actinoplanes sp. RD1 TaxID=3064538 RepID=UPI0027426497|nr:nuclear transport factor 2 family protein [Actinoplanes sp. RD1]